MAVGKLSLEDWPILTWSLGWTGFLPPRLSRQHLVGAAGDHLVGIHVGLGAGAGLPDHQRKLVVQLAVDDFLRGRGDGLAQLAVERAQRHVGRGRRLLQQAERMDQRQRHALAADAEILQRTLRLRAPVMRSGHRDLAHGIALNACLLGGHAEPPQKMRGSFSPERGAGP